MPRALVNGNGQRPLYETLFGTVTYRNPMMSSDYSRRYVLQMLDVAERLPDRKRPVEKRTGSEVAVPSNCSKEVKDDTQD